MPDYYICAEYGPNVDAIQRALQMAEQIAIENNTGILICAPTKKTVASSVLNQAIPETQIERMLKGDTLQLNGNVPIRLESQRTIPVSTGDVVIALHPPATMLAKLDNAVQTPAVITVPWSEADVASWIESHTPDTIMDSPPTDENGA